MATPETPAGNASLGDLQAQASIRPVRAAEPSKATEQSCLGLPCVLMRSRKLVEKMNLGRESYQVPTSYALAPLSLCLYGNRRYGN